MNALESVIGLQTNNIREIQMFPDKILEDGNQSLRNISALQLKVSQTLPKNTKEHFSLKKLVDLFAESLIIQVWSS